ncbi:MAG: trypsin-like peptidase domain-containing protein, partial [Bacteroidetes bacterium]|nr:trypsin-like peptidase domain-containing protein [Bacteroidota bacterium]
QYYEQALAVSPDNPLALSKLSEVKNLIAQIADAENTKKYKEAIENADKAFSNKMYSQARAMYQQAQDIRPAEVYPGKQIAEIDKKLAASTNNLEKKDWDKIYEESKPAVLFIFDMEYNYYNREMEAVPIGTGFFFTNNGYAITNKHIYDVLTYKECIVLSGQDSVYVVDSWYKMDEDKDYAIFKVKLARNEKVKCLPISNSACKEGQEVCLIGNPQGLKFSVKAGLISSFIGKFTIEHSVSTEGGSSGSPLINRQGQVIGIHNSGMKGKGNNNFATDIRQIPLYLYR